MKLGETIKCSQLPGRWFRVFHKQDTMCVRVSTIVVVAVMLLMNLNCSQAEDWGSITIKPVDGSHEVVLENSQIRAVYKESPNNWAGRHPTCMV
ncbi:MAG: hypothetical protein JSW59_19980, partial [Phycisphaerales bacterium]